MLFCANNLILNSTPTCPAAAAVPTQVSGGSLVDVDPILTHLAHDLCLLRPPGGRLPCSYYGFYI